MPLSAHGKPESFLASLQNLRRQSDQYSRFLRGLFLHKHSLLTNHFAQLFAVNQITQQLIGALYIVETCKAAGNAERALFHALMDGLFDEAFDAIQIVKQAFLDAGLEQRNEQLTAGLTGTLLEIRRTYQETRDKPVSAEVS